MTDHETITAREHMVGAAWLALALVCKLPLCRIGLHDDCACCSPGYCTRCKERQADETRPGLARLPKWKEEMRP